MIKRSVIGMTLAAILAAMVSVAAPSPASAQAPGCYPGVFTDVAPENPFFADISWMIAEGITTGFPDCTYHPTDATSRQAMAAFIWRYMNEPPPPPGAPTFPDVPPSSPFYDAVSWMAGTGLTDGKTDGTYGATDPVSRQVMAAFLYRLSGSPTVPANAPTFPDVPPSNPFYDAIRWNAMRQIAGGYEDGTFRPTFMVSRQSMAGFLHRYDVQEGNTGAPVTSTEDLGALEAASSSSAIEEIASSPATRMVLVVPMALLGLAYATRRRNATV